MENEISLIVNTHCLAIKTDIFLKWLEVMTNELVNDDSFSCFFDLIRFDCYIMFKLYLLAFIKFDQAQKT